MYIAKFYPDSITLHPDFSPSTLTMDTLSINSYPVIAESGATISS